MFKVVNESGAVFVSGDKRAVFATKEQAEAVAEWFTSPRYGSLRVEPMSGAELLSEEQAEYLREKVEAFA